MVVQIFLLFFTCGEILPTVSLNVINHHRNPG